APATAGGGSSTSTASHGPTAASMRTSRAGGSVASSGTYGRPRASAATNAASIAGCFRPYTTTGASVAASRDAIPCARAKSSPRVTAPSAPTIAGRSAGPPPAMRATNGSANMPRSERLVHEADGGVVRREPHEQDADRDGEVVEHEGGHANGPRTRPGHAGAPPASRRSTSATSARGVAQLSRSRSAGETTSPKAASS